MKEIYAYNTTKIDEDEIMAVLVVDDNPNRLRTHAGHFTDLNASVKVAKSTKEANDIIKTNPVFDTVLLDINFDPDDMDNIDGLEFGRHLKKIGYPARRAAYSEFLDENSGLLGEIGDVFEDVQPHDLPHEYYKGLLEKGRKNYLEKLQHTRLKAREVLSLDDGEVEKLAQLHDSISPADCDLEELYKEYAKDGYRVRLASTEDDKIFFGVKFLLWSRDYDGGVYVEVHKLPSIYGYGNNEEKALEMLNDVIVGLYAGAATNSSQSENEGLREAFSFVKMLYERA